MHHRLGPRHQNDTPVAGFSRSSPATSRSASVGTTYRRCFLEHSGNRVMVPSVPRLFWFFHADGPELLRSPLSNVVIDDGRRYLERTSAQYDVITIDPPPPVEAAGSSLLYSKEFYATINRRLRSGGILQQWLPYGDAVVQASVARALKESFRYVRVFHPVGGVAFTSRQPTTAARPDSRGIGAASKPQGGRRPDRMGPGANPRARICQRPPQRTFSLPDDPSSSASPRPAGRPPRERVLHAAPPRRISPLRSL